MSSNVKLTEQSVAPKSPVSSSPSGAKVKKRKAKSPWAFGRPKTKLRTSKEGLRVEAAMKEKEEKRRQASRGWIDTFLEIGEGIGESLTPIVEPFFGGFEKDVRFLIMIRQSKCLCNACSINDSAHH